MALKPGPKRIAKSTGKPDRRARDNKDTPGNTPSLKAPKRKKKQANEAINITSVQKFILFKFYTLVAIYENRLNFFITYILSNTRFLIRTKRLAFILALASVG